MPIQTYKEALGTAVNAIEQVLNPRNEFIVVDMYNRILYTADNYNDAIQWAKQEVDGHITQYNIYKKFAEICDEIPF